MNVTLAELIQHINLLESTCAKQAQRIVELEAKLKEQDGKNVSEHPTASDGECQPS